MTKEQKVAKDIVSIVRDESQKLQALIQSNMMKGIAPTPAVADQFIADLETKVEETLIAEYVNGHK